MPELPEIEKKTPEEMREILKANGWMDLFEDGQGSGLTAKDMGWMKKEWMGKHDYYKMLAPLEGAYAAHRKSPAQLTERLKKYVDKINHTIELTDHIAFGFNYNGGKHDTIIVSNITSISKFGILCHFMYGHHSLAEYIKPEEVLAVGDNENGTISIKGWGGKYRVLKSDSELLKENTKEE